MAFLLAVLGPAKSPGTREIRARGERRREAVGPAVAALPTGSVVLLHGEGAPWEAATALRPGSWPAGLAGVEALWAQRSGRRRIALQGTRLQGRWLLDDRRPPRALEWMVVREGEGELTVLNYAGWRGADLPREVEVVIVPGPAGELGIVTPEAAPRPAGRGFAGLMG